MAKVVTEKDCKDTKSIEMYEIMGKMYEMLFLLYEGHNDFCH